MADPAKTNRLLAIPCLLVGLLCLPAVPALLDEGSPGGVLGILPAVVGVLLLIAALGSFLLAARLLSGAQRRGFAIGAQLLAMIAQLLGLLFTIDDDFFGIPFFYLLGALLSLLLLLVFALRSKAAQP